MKRIYNILVILFINLLVPLSCTNDKKNIQEDNIYNSKTKYLNLSNAKGKYYFVPSMNEEDYPNYITFNIKKGDSIILEIRSDSSFVFNHFYYDRMFRVDNYSGKVKRNLDDRSKIFIPFPNESTNLQGFLTSKNDTLFFNRISMKNFENYEYRLLYKKKK